MVDMNPTQSYFANPRTFKTVEAFLTDQGVTEDLVLTTETITLADGTKRNIKRYDINQDGTFNIEDDIKTVSYLNGNKRSSLIRNKDKVIEFGTGSYYGNQWHANRLEDDTPYIFTLTNDAMINGHKLHGNLSSVNVFNWPHGGFMPKTSERDAYARRQ